MPLAKNHALSSTDHAATLRRRHEAATSESRKERGQIFIPPGIARFMACLLRRFPEPFRLLDPGPGVGLLSSAVCERLCAPGPPRRIDIHLYETDRTLLPLVGRPDRRMLFDDAGDEEDFDAVVMNPPYVKIGAGAPQALTMGDAFRAVSISSDFGSIDAILSPRRGGTGRPRRGVHPAGNVADRP
jgi:hypothetical protein